MLCWGSVEKARHEHMSDEYKKQYTIDVPPSPSLAKVRDTTMIPSELSKRGKVKRANTGLSNTYHMTKLRELSQQHPIGHNSPLIYSHFEFESFQ